MNQLRFLCTCNRCGGPLTYINGGHPSSLEACVVMACVPCRAQFAVRVQMVDLGAERITAAKERERNVETRRHLQRDLARAS